MDSCPRGAFLSGVGFLVSLNWLQAARAEHVNDFETQGVKSLASG
jgi:hypothetical protein